MSNAPQTQLLARAPADLPQNLSASVVAIGNFDGVHRGHQAVLKQALAIAQSKQLPLIALTFEPHPRSFFNPQNPVFRLTEPRVKRNLLFGLGASIVFEQEFDEAFRSLSADEFIDDLLLEKLKARHVVAGHDFHFGRKRTGTPQYLQDRVNAKGYNVTLVEPFCDENGGVISSSRVRTALEEGNLAQANGLLGYTYRIAGEVISGKQIGRTIGYPTANIELPASSRLRTGIYAVKVERADGSIHDGVASHGRRPTFDNGKVLFETFLFGFDGDLYGEELTIFLHARLRDELKFDTVEELVIQMNRDSEEARAVLSAIPPEKDK